MAKKATPTPPAPEPLPFGSRQTTRIILVILGTTLLLAAFVTPWWTRGMNVDQNKAEKQGDGGTFGSVPGVEGIYLNYGPFHTPGGLGFTTDASRETATAVLGIGLLACTLCILTANVLRWLMATGRIQNNYDAPVRLAIVAFVCGVFAVLWGAFFLPLAGANPGMLYGKEYGSNLSQQSNGIVEATRYANAGFFLAIIGAVLYPGYLWADAHRTRAVLGDSTNSWVADTEKKPVTY